MDYSKFYLKNYVPTDEPVEEEDKIIFPRLEARTQPEIMYINPDGEVFDPELKSETDEKEDINILNNGQSSINDDKNENVSVYEGIEENSSYNHPHVARKQIAKKQSLANRFCQVMLIFTIVVMSIIVSADFLTDGKAIAAIMDCFKANKIEYYAVLENPRDDITSSQVDSYAMRLKGGAGFTVKNADKYYNVYAVFDNVSDAESYSKENGGQILTLNTEFYDDIQGELKSYKDYPVKTVDDLNKILSDQKEKKITTAQAIEKLGDVKEDFAMTYDNMNNAAKGDNEDKSVTLLANASVALSALEYLCDTTVSRPNLACDIRYTVCRIIFTYCYSA